MNNFQMPENDRHFLEAYCKDDLCGGLISVKRKTERRRLLDRHAMAFAMKEIGIRYPHTSLVDANAIRKNNPGFDLLFNGSLRIQVKGRCWVEMIDFSVPSLSRPKAWESDIWLAVDFAGLIDGRHGKYENTAEMAPSYRVEAYILPTLLLREMAEAAFAESKRPRIRAIKPGSMFSRRHHRAELFEYRNRWDLLMNLLR